MILILNACLCNIQYCLFIQFGLSNIFLLTQKSIQKQFELLLLLKKNIPKEEHIIVEIKKSQMLCPKSILN